MIDVASALSSVSPFSHEHRPDHRDNSGGEKFSKMLEQSGGSDLQNTYLLQDQSNLAGVFAVVSSSVTHGLGTGTDLSSPFSQTAMPMGEQRGETYYLMSTMANGRFAITQDEKESASKLSRNGESAMLTLVRPMLAMTHEPQHSDLPVAKAVVGRFPDQILGSNVSPTSRFADSTRDVSRKQQITEPALVIVPQQRKLTVCERKDGTGIYLRDKDIEPEQVFQWLSQGDGVFRSLLKGQLKSLWLNGTNLLARLR